MAGYSDTKAMIIAALMGRTSGSEIQPSEQQAYELNMLDYIRSVELVGTSTLEGIAQASTVPVQPTASKACYIAGVAQNQTVTFTNFKDSSGNPISITTGDMQGVLVILVWNMEYWDYYTFDTYIVSSPENADFYYSFNIRKTYASVALMTADVSSPIGTDGKKINIGDLVTVVNSSDSTENAYYSYEGTSWKFQLKMNFSLVQLPGADENSVMSQKVVTDYLNTINVDVISPLTSGYYTLETAIAAVPSAMRKVGCEICFKPNLNEVRTYIFRSGTLAEWNILLYWVCLDSIDISQFSNINLLSILPTEYTEISANDGYILNIAGSISAYSGFKCTDIIYNNGNDFIYYKSSFTNVSLSYANICFFDIYGNFICYKRLSQGNNIVKLPPNYGIRICVESSIKIYQVTKYRVSDESYAENKIEFGNSLFIEKKDPSGIYDRNYLACIKKRCEGILFIEFVVCAYSTHTVFSCFDSDGNEIDGYSITGVQGLSSKITVYLPENAYYYSCGCVPVANTGDNSGTINGCYITEYCKTMLSTDRRNIVDFVSPDRNKRILILGTSIPAYSDYFDFSLKKFGVKYYKNCLGSSGVVKRSGVLGTDRDGKDLSESKEEKVERYSSHIGDGTNGTITQDRYDSMMGWGYDKLIIPYIDGTIASCKTIIFDHGYNDVEEIYDELSNIQNTDFGPRSDADRSTFSGAMSFILYKIWAIDPTIKIIISGFLEDQSGLDKKGGYGICTILKKIASSNGLSYLDVASLSGFSVKFVPNSSTYISTLNSTYSTDYSPTITDSNGNITFYQYFCPDGTHPHTDPTGISIQRLHDVYRILLKNNL